MNPSLFSGVFVSGTRRLASLFAAALAAVALLHAAPTRAQSLEELEAQYRQLCAQPQNMRDTCDMLKRGLDQMRALGPAPAAAATGRAEPRDGSATCDCNRTRGRCQATARIVSQSVRPHSYGLGSRVVVRVEPPPGQCVEVTAYLEETATFSNGPRRTGHPLYRVVQAATDIEWTNGSTPAQQLNYRVPVEQVECWLCTPRGAAGGERSAAAEGAAQAREDIRKAWEKEYRDCLDGVGPLMSQLTPDRRLPICEQMRQEQRRQGY
jgi:hypothetical protein